MFDTLRLNNFFFNLFPNTLFLTTTKFYLYPSFTEVLNNNTDKKKIHYPFLKLFELPYKKYDLANYASLSKINSDTELSTFSPLFLNIFDNLQVINKSYSSFSPNQSVSAPEKSLRKSANIYANTANFNLSAELNPLSTYFNRLSSSLNANTYLFTSLSNSS